MASPLDAEIEPSVQNSAETLFRLPAWSHCCQSAAFLLTTALTLSDLITDIWLIVDYGLQQHMAYLAVGLFSLLLAQFGSASLYAIQMKDEDAQRRSLVRHYACLLLNFPLHLGILAHRLHHNCRHCEHCFSSGAALQSMSDAHAPNAFDVEWKFAKIKVLQSLLQCAPQLTLNLVHMLRYSHQANSLHFASAITSFLSLVVGVVQHEQGRRTGSDTGSLSAICLFCCHALLLGARILAVGCFVFLYGAWTAAVLSPHLAVCLISLCYEHRGTWPAVPIYKLCLHGVYALITYVPVHHEYRAHGQMLACHGLLLVENILMSCLPFALTANMPVPESLQPHSPVYIALCSAILSGSVVGSAFLALHTCFLESPYASLPSSSGKSLTGCCSCCSCLRRNSDDDTEAAQPPTTLSVNGGAGGSLHRARRRKRMVDTSYLSTQTGAGPPLRYQSLEEEGGGTPPELTDSPPAIVRGLARECAAVQLMSPGSVLGVGGTLVFSPDDRGACRPSILEGDEDSEAEVTNDSDKVPLTK